jgi:hypothetical protein
VENVLVVRHSPKLAAAYRENWQRLWNESQDVAAAYWLPAPPTKHNAHYQTRAFSGGVPLSAGRKSTAEKAA